MFGKKACDLLREVARCNPEAIPPFNVRPRALRFDYICYLCWKEEGVKLQPTQVGHQGPHLKLKTPVVMGRILRHHAGRSASTICSKICLPTSSRGYSCHQCYSCLCIFGSRSQIGCHMEFVSAVSNGPGQKRRC